MKMESASKLSVSVVLQGEGVLPQGNKVATGFTITDLDHLIKILNFQVLEKGKDVSGSIVIYDEDSFNE